MTAPDEERRERILAKQAKAELLQQEALRARADYAAARDAEDAKTERLRIMRLAKEEADKIVAAEHARQHPETRGPKAKRKSQAKAK